MSVVMSPEDGHLDVLVLSEQHRPRVKGNRLEFTHCLDVVFRYYGRQSLSCLRVLTQDGKVGEDLADYRDLLFTPVPYGQTGEFNWVFLQDPEVSQNHARLWLPSETLGSSPLQFDVVQLHPVVQTPAWMLEDAHREAAAAVMMTHLSFAAIFFEGDQEIRPYDPEQPGETTYWLRLCFQSLEARDASPTMEFGSSTDRFLSLQPYSILGSQALLDRLNDELECLAQKQSTAAGATEAKELMFDRTFYKDGSGVAIRDYRISLVTDRYVLVMNPHSDGLCMFTNVERIQKPNDTLAHVWIAGGEQFWESDPMGMAREVYYYLREWGGTEGEAKTKEQVSTAVCPRNHLNVCFVIEALKKLGFIRERSDGSATYCINKEGISNADLILERGGSVTTEARLDRYVPIRDVLYGSLPLPASKTGSSRFRRTGFRVQSTLGFIADSKNIV